MRYDYECVKCNNIEEISHSIKEDPKIKCKKCGKQMKKMISTWTNINMNNHWGTSIEEANS